MLDATRLRVLVAVAKHGSVTAAAHALNYAQPSISHHIARLEAETGAKLMERAGRGVRLTDAGHLLAERAEEILGRLDAAEAELAVHIGQRQDTVRLTAFGSALSTLVAAAAAALHREHAGSVIHLTQAEPAKALRMLRAGETDIALIFRYLRDGTQPESLPPDAKNPDDAGYSGAQLLLDEPMYLIAHPAESKHEPAASPVEQAASPVKRAASQVEQAASPVKPAASQRSPAAEAAPSDSEARAAILAAYAHQRWIGTDEQCGDFLLDLCHQAGIWPDLAIRTSDFVAAQALVAAGLGVTIVPSLALRAARHPGIQAMELPGARRQVLAVTYPASPRAPAATRLMDALLQARS
jgi:DNA-binding transcriptional LysR family regulator